MLAIGTVLLSAAMAAGHIIPTIIPRDFNDTLPSGNDTSNYTMPDRGNYTWTPTCRLAALNGVADSVGFDYQGGCVATTGTVRAFMFFVDFPDAPAGNDSAQDMHDKLVPEATAWYAQASYGAMNLSVTADTSAYYRIPKTAQSYNWLSGLGTYGQEAYVQDALDAFTANGARPPPAEVDVLYVVPTGNAAQWISRSQTSSIAISTRQGQMVAKKTTTFGADDWDLNSRTMVHETGHAFCLPDYYTFGNDRPGVYVGGFSMMALTQATAPDFFAWDKWRMGWIHDDAVDCVLDAGSTEHVLTPLAVAGGGKKAVVVAQTETTALVAEVRIAAGLDKEACAPGVLLYTVDTQLPTGSGPVRVLDATPDSGGCVGLFEDLMDSALSLTLEGSKSLAYAPVSSYEVKGWGVKVTLVSVADQKYTIRVDRQNSARTM
ncbi:hypothetical protein PG989_010941 [Apiospora arundinis]|uniref:M6 family metalloprotease domain-containing protein n=1 Tax=Apiospora arundinis TaxID=335852 RepID=A0ABR2HPZ7_9PEZI